MIDLETLDVKPSAVILTVGAVKFNPQTISARDELQELYMRVDINEQDKLNRSISENTVTWWQTQDEEVQNEAFTDEGRLQLSNVIEEINKFVWNSGKVWSQGSFDINILENLYNSLDISPPWQYWQVRDSRTLFDYVDGSLDKTINLHNALEDAAQQALAVQRALSKIR